jgi:hypothetical protein
MTPFFKNVKTARLVKKQPDLGMAALSERRRPVAAISRPWKDRSVLNSDNSTMLDGGLNTGEQ